MNISANATISPEIAKKIYDTHNLSDLMKLVGSGNSAIESLALLRIRMLIYELWSL